MLTLAAAPPNQSKTLQAPRRTHLRWVSLVIKQNGVPHAINNRFFGANAVVQNPNLLTHLV
jgi:hypothetical protein